MRRSPALLALVLVLLSLARAEAAPAELASDWRLCKQTIAAEERRSRVPTHLLAAIAMNESGRTHPDLKKRLPWPWTVMAEGQGRYLPSKAAAIAEVEGLRARGVRNIDVGCMQINLHHHARAFDSLEEAFDPASNVAYAARFLTDLFEQTGSWAEAAGRYHSATPEFKEPYQQRVMTTWAREQREAGGDDALLASLGGDAASVAAGGPASTRPAAPWRAALAPGSPMRVDRGLTLMPLRQPVLAQASTPALRLLPLAPARALPPIASGANRDVPREESFAQRRAQYLDQWRDLAARAGRAPAVLAARETTAASSAWR